VPIAGVGKIFKHTMEKIIRLISDRPNRHENKAWFMDLRFLMLILPSFLGAQISFQACKIILLE
jgi:hypothetical protein